MRVSTPAQALFAASLIAVGALGLMRGDFAPVWEPVPRTTPAREFLVYLSAGISLACGLGLLWVRTAPQAARLLLLSLVLWLLLFRVPVVLHAPAVEVSWENCAETVVILAGAWVLYAWLAPGWDRRHLRAATGKDGVRIAQVLYGVALIPFGFAHFVYARETAALVPAWLPAHLAWAYLTGAAYIAAGVAVLVGVRARLAAVLSAWQMGMFTLLVWLPIVSRGGADTFQWSETVLSFALTMAAWVVAESARGTGRA
jgi:uncharacterized membrane protein